MRLSQGMTMQAWMQTTRERLLTMTLRMIPRRRRLLMMIYYYSTRRMRQMSLRMMTWSSR